MAATMPFVFPGPPLNVKNFGAKGNGSHDDTTAVQAAVDAAVSVNGTLYLPAGDYLATGLSHTAGSLAIRGAGIDATRLLTTVATPVFSLGTFDSTPANAWIGQVQGFDMADLTFQNVDESSIADVGDQTSIGIQDNGCGNVTGRNVAFKGLKYGIYAPYGHDYCRYYGVDFTECTTSMYFGPGSQQIYIFGGSSTLHDRAIVIEGAAQGAVYGFVFNEPKTRDIDILSPDTLESGVTGLTLANELGWTFNDCWYETGAGWNTGWGPTEHVRVGNVSDTLRIFSPKFVNSSIASGTGGMAVHTGGITYAFVNVQKGALISVDHVTVSGAYIQSIVTQPPASYQLLTVKDNKTVDGYTPIPSFASRQIGSSDISSFAGMNIAVTGSRAGNAALASLLSALTAEGIINDQSS